MFKHFFSGLILFLAVLVGVYQLRIQLLTTAFNAALKQADIRLLQLEGLDVGWDGLFIDRLLLAVGNDSAPQLLESIHLTYSILDIQPHSLTVKHAVLTVPDSSGEQVDDSLLLLTDVLDQVMAGPLQFISVDVIELDGAASPALSPPLSLQINWEDDEVSLAVKDQDRALLLQLQSMIPGRQSLAVELVESGRSVVEFTATITQEKNRHFIEGEGSLWLDTALPLISNMVDVSRPLDTVSGELLFLLSGDLDDNIQAMQDITLSLVGNEISWQLDGDQPTVVQQLWLNLSGQLTLDDEQLSAVVNPGEWLRIQSLTQGDRVFNEPSLIAGSLGSFNYKLGTGELNLGVSELQLGLPQVEMPDVNLATSIGLRGLAVNRDANGVIGARVHLLTDSMNLQRPDIWLPVPVLDFELVIAGNNVSANGVLRGGGQKALFDVELSHALDTGSGAARVVASTLAFDADENRLSAYFPYWPFDWDIYEGELEIDLGLRWKNAEQATEIQGEIKQRLRGVAGVYGEIGFVGLDADFSAVLQSPDQLISLKPAVISLQSLDVGVPIEAIELRFLLNAARQELTLESLEARIFDGRVWIEDAVYRLNRDHNAIYIGVDGIRLDKLLELTGYDAIEGSGTISGLLPLDVSEAGITMTRGMLAARAPGGVFRYHTEIVAGTNPAMVQVIEALNNYHYSVFQVEADYLDNGDLVLAMVLRGSNPGLQQGRPIHLNLNVTDNIPMLLKSLQSGRVIADTVSGKLGGKTK